MGQSSSGLLPDPGLPPQGHSLSRGLSLYLPSLWLNLLPLDSKPHLMQEQEGEGGPLPWASAKSTRLCSFSHSKLLLSRAPFFLSPSVSGSPTRAALEIFPLTRRASEGRWIWALISCDHMYWPMSRSAVLFQAWAAH